LMDQGREEEAQAMLDRAKVVLDGRQQREATVSSKVALRVGGDVTSPSLLVKVEPSYSPEAHFASYRGTVVCSVEIVPDGTAQNIRIVKGAGLGLDEKAIEAIRQWRFKPGT